jgi:hypothetical protein
MNWWAIVKRPSGTCDGDGRWFGLFLPIHWWDIAIGGILQLVGYCNWWDIAIGGILQLVGYCNCWDIVRSIGADATRNSDGE